MRIRHACKGFIFSLLGTASLLGREQIPPRDYHWHAFADFVYMRRSEAGDKVLVEDSKKVRECGSCDDFDMMTSGTLVKDFDYQPGYRLGLVYTMNLRSSFEAIFLWVHPWHGDHKVLGDKSLYFPFTHLDYTDDYHNANRAKGEYTSQFWDAEVNYWYSMAPRRKDYFSFSVIGGARYFHWNEGFRLTFVKPPDTSDWRIHTQNDVYGLQIGANLQMNPTARRSWDFIAKFGWMLNRAEQKNVLKDDNNTVTLRHSSRHKWQLGVFADALAQLSYQCLNHLSVHTGYEMIYVSGLALAAEQTKQEGKGERVYTHGYGIIHGLLVGLTLGF